MRERERARKYLYPYHVYSPYSKGTTTDATLRPSSRFSLHPSPVTVSKKPSILKLSHEQ